jgi:hypothetical protein
MPAIFLGGREGGGGGGDYLQEYVSVGAVCGERRWVLFVGKKGRYLTRFCPVI